MIILMHLGAIINSTRAELEKDKYPSILDTEEHFQIEEHCGKIPQQAELGVPHSKCKLGGPK